MRFTNDKTLISLSLTATFSMKVLMEEKVMNFSESQLCYIGPFSNEKSSRRENSVTTAWGILAH